MKVETLTVFVCSVFCATCVTSFVVSGENIKIEFKVSSYEKCLEDGKANVLLRDISLNQCVLDCTERLECVAVNYRRNFLHCEQFASEDGNFEQNSRKTGQCMFVRMTDVIVTLHEKPQQFCRCQEGKTCGTESGFCVNTVCAKLTIENGTLNGDMTEVGARVTYTCDADFVEKDGQTSSTCLSNGLWTHEPECIKVCEMLEVENGILNEDKRNIRSVVTSTCNAGFVVKDGQTSSTCLSNGLWTHEPECIKVCERLEVENGTLNENNREVAAVVTYTCNAGFVEKDGQISSTCQSNGLWTHEPKCIKVCERLMIENGTLIDDDRKVGAVVNYTCNAGFNEKDGQTSTTCQSNGLWTHEPKCVKVCERLMIENGTLIDDDRKVGAVVNYTCNAGFNEKDGQTSTTCQSNGLWTHEPKCVKVCERLMIENGTLIDDDRKVGAVVNYTCNAGFNEKDGQTSTTCQSNGLWTHEPKCVKVCERLMIENGTLIDDDRKVGAVVTYTCNAGFNEKDGQTSSTCQSNGLWTHEPKCVKVCERLMIENGTLIDDDRKVGAVVNYTCNAGFNEKDGQTSSTCQSNGLWTHEPKCVKVCERLMIENGTVIDDDRKVGAVVNYTCNAGFNEKDGQTSTTCQSNGLWTYEPECIRHCIEPDIHPNSSISKGPTTEGTTRVYSCHDFFRLSVDSNTERTTCGNDGTWSATDFRCVLDYKYVGCHITHHLTVKDSTLLVPFTDIVNMTPELCVSYCFSHGNIYAAVRNELCICGNNFSTYTYSNTTEANCDQRCPGDRNLTCGSSWTFSVFKKSDDENYLGCYIDLNPDRILNGVHDVQMDQMTTNTCLEICRNHEMKYAYTEFSNECFCGNELQNAVKVADNECSMPCSGNDAEFCGNNLRASLYSTD